MTVRDITDEEFEEFPAPTTPKKESQWAETVDKLARGGAVAIPYRSAKELRGIRIGLARTAAAKNIKLEFRPREDSPNQGELAVRKSNEPYIKKTAKGGTSAKKNPAG